MSIQTTQRLNLKALIRVIRFPSDPYANFTMEYPAELPDAVPDGLVLVHNTVRPARRQGTRGFRFWFQSPVPGLEPCSCPWAPELGQHHRVARRNVAA